MTKEVALNPTQWTREFEKHRNEVMPFEKWKNIRDLSLKRELLRTWRMKFSDKLIRESWNLRHSNFYYHLNKVGLKGSGDSSVPDFVNNILSQGNPEKAPTITPDTPHVIEAEFEVLSDSIKDDKNLWRLPPIMSFQEEGPASRIIKRLEAIIVNLELETDVLELNIEIRRK